MNNLERRYEQLQGKQFRSVYLFESSVTLSSDVIPSYLPRYQVNPPVVSLPGGVDFHSFIIRVFITNGKFYFFPTLVHPRVSLERFYNRYKIKI